MSRHNSSPIVSANLLAGVAVLGLSLLTGCGAGILATESAALSGDSTGSNTGGILHGGPNPVVGATVTLYTTTSGGYGATANVVATTTTNSSGSFSFVLPTNVAACPSGEYAYVGAYSGSTGTFTNNTSSLLMVPIGLCDSNYTTTDNAGVYTNTYTGSYLWIDELTTAVSAYALGNFMTVTDGGIINIGAPTNNHSTASASTPSAAGLSHAFENALALLNIHTGQPAAYTHGGTSVSTGGVIPDAEIFLLGNILQACVNSNGVTGTNTATSNDGSGCGMLFSYTTPPQAGAAVPANTLQAMVDLAKYPNPQVNTWNTLCTAAGSGTTTATSCLFGLAASSGAYVGALTAAPPDWALAVVYETGYGANSTSTLCTTSPNCPGLTYPYYVALDYEDNAYVLNWSSSSTTYTNIIGIAYDGTPIFSSPEDTTDTAIKIVGTDTAGHVFGADTAATSLVKVYNASSGAVLSTVTTGIGAMSGPLLADLNNNIYVASVQTAINIRKLTYGGTSSAPTYSAASITTTAPTGGVSQIGWDPSLDIYLLSSTPTAYILPNTGTFAAPTFSATGLTSATVTGSTSNAYGIGATSAGNAFVIDSVGITPITKTGSAGTTTLSAGTPVALPTVINSTLYNRAVSVDGLNNVFSPDGANGSAVTGVSVYDGADGIALGTYKGCYVISKACGTTSAGQVPMYSPRGAAIDSAGDVWVVSGSSANLTELIGAAAPTWPGLSMGKFGRPQ
jgi:hypothetical protein